MKVGIFLPSDAQPTIGGGFSFLDRFVEAIDKSAFAPGLEICFVGRHPVHAVNFSKKYFQLSSTGLYRFYRVLERLNITSFLRLVTRHDLNFRNNRDRRILTANNIDVVLYLRQSQCEIYEFPFISVNWDIAHKSSFAFPEFSDEANSSFRNKWYQEDIQKALAIFAESESGRKELIKYCNLFSRRVFVVPLFPGRVVEMNVDEKTQQTLLSKLGLEPQNYFYYPAQFWAHKNHYNLIKGFSKLRSRKKGNFKMVFTGSDQGNKEYIKEVIASEGLSTEVLPLGFLANEEVYALIRNAAALVMPTFLGPTNMPLIEAQHLGTPVICSDFEGHREICGDGALYIDPLDSDGIGNALEQMLDKDLRRELAARTAEHARGSVFRIEVALERFEEALLSIIPLRKTFR